MLNRAILIGNLGKDPEIRTTKDGREIAHFSLATSERWRDKAGERQEVTTWHNIVVMNDGLVKVVKNYLHKGSKVYLEGQISNRSYEKDGETKYISEVVLKGFNATLVMLDSKEAVENELDDEIDF